MEATAESRLIDLSHVLPNTFAWQEHLNQTGSMKDRMARYAIELARAKGELPKKQSIVEASSGNTGAALAFVGRALNHPVHIFVSSTVSQEKKERIREFGGIVHEIDVNEGAQAEVRRAKDFADKQGYYYFDQFSNPYHIEGYQRTIVPELLLELEERSILIDTFVGGVGSGASVLAVGQGLREKHNPDLRIVTVTPSVFPSDIEGLHPAHLSPVGEFPIWAGRPQGFESESVTVEDRDAYQACFTLRENGLTVGPGSGATFAVTCSLPREQTKLFLFCDRGEKYEQKFMRWRRQIDPSSS